jgi:hypothetical protein
MFNSSYNVKADVKVTIVTTDDLIAELEKYPGQKIHVFTDTDSYGMHNINTIDSFKILHDGGVVISEY